MWFSKLYFEAEFKTIWSMVGLHSIQNVSAAEHKQYIWQIEWSLSIASIRRDAGGFSDWQIYTNACECTE